MRLSDKHLLNYSQRLLRLRYLAIGFLLFLLIPVGTLLFLGYQQLEKNVFDEYQREAKNLVRIINRKLFKRLTFSNTLPVYAFDYYQQVYNPVTKQSQQVLSPLSTLNSPQLNTEQQIKGLVGYFQYDSQGRFNSPMWPYTISGDNADNANHQETGPELTLSKKAAFDLYHVVSESKAIQHMIQHGFSEEDSLFSTIFDTPDYFIFYRVALVAEQHRLQGYLVKRKPYLSQLLTTILEMRHFNSPVLVELKYVKHSDQVEYFFYKNLPNEQAKVSQSLQADNRFQQQPIFSAMLHWPYTDYSVSISTHSLPITPAMMYSGIFIIILIATILSACYGFYHLGVKQLALAEQRLNFVSSVSHELKTPLTSIRMYSEMLKEGTVISEDYKKEYYQFIYYESERLTRLINNILQLSKISNQQQNTQPKYTPLTVLQDIIRSKTSSIIDKNRFQQNMILEIENAEHILVFVEQDAFSQMIINITDNAIKFFNQEQINDPSRQKIDFIFRQHLKHKHMIQLEIRDYGEGISLEQESKIFELFYRGGNELTRATQGTGIGLALVNELVSAQQGEIRVERKDPGLAMVFSFQCKLRDTVIK